MLLEIKDVTKRFGNNDIVKNVNMTLKSGKIYGFIGRNGSGKSVLLKMICGFYVPTTGCILQDGYNYIANNSFPKDTRALIEKPSFLSDLSGFENLKLLASIKNEITDDDINKTIEMVNLSSDANKKYSKYSLGMKQKLGIAQVLMENPKMIVLDEPFNGVENDTAKKIRNVLKQEKSQDKIIIIASHIKEDIENLADIIYEFDNGIIKEHKNEK
jgi:ABC-2 type transport system ATP-binding protein